MFIFVLPSDFESAPSHDCIPQERKKERERKKESLKIDREKEREQKTKILDPHPFPRSPYSQ